MPGPATRPLYEPAARSKLGNMRPRWHADKTQYLGDNTQRTGIPNVQHTELPQFDSGNERANVVTGHL
jgi:hypothetical protein